MIRRVREASWRAGWPVRSALVGLVRLYRITLGPVFPSGCRFYPTCSVYAEQAIGELGCVRGSALAIWRVLRCSPLTGGGVDRPPRRGWSVGMYDAGIQYDGDVHGHPADLPDAVQASPEAVA